MLASGQPGTKVGGPFTTKNDGSWSGAVSSGLTGSFVIVATGGSYTDESTGTLTTLSELQSAVDSINQVMPITPLTQTMVDRVKQHLAVGSSKKAAIMLAKQAMVSAFGFDPTKETPTDPLNPSATATTAQSQYAATLGGLSKLINANPTLTTINGAKSSDIMKAVAKDMVDLKLDGKENGVQITVNVNGTAVSLPALDTAGMTALKTAITGFQAVNKKGLKTPSLVVTPPANLVAITKDSYGFLTITESSVGVFSQNSFIPLSTTTTASTYRWNGTSIQINVTNSANIASVILSDGISLWSKIKTALTSSTPLVALGVTIDVKNRTLTFSNVVMNKSNVSLINRPTITLNGTLKY